MEYFANSIYRFLGLQKLPKNTSLEDHILTLNFEIQKKFNNVEKICSFFIKNSIPIENCKSKSNEELWKHMRTIISKESLNSLIDTSLIFDILEDSKGYSLDGENKEMILEFIDYHINLMSDLKRKIITMYYKIFKIHLDESLPLIPLWDNIYEVILWERIDINKNFLTKEEVTNSFYFGLELETCINVSEQKFENNIEMMSYLINVFNQKSIEMKNDIKWGTYYDDNNGLSKDSANYEIWNIVPDKSVKCPGENPEKNLITFDQPRYCVLKNVYMKNCPELKYFNAEIVSPKLQYPEGLEILKNVYLNYLMDDNLTYLVNKSQGLHIHISNEFLNVCKFLQLWVIFEKIFYKLVPTERRETNMYAKPVSAYYDEILFSETIDQLALEIPDYIYDKYRTVNCKEYENNRIEIRLYQSTMIYEEIYNWVKLCIDFCIYSIFLTNEEISEIKTYNENQLEYLLFNTIISEQSVSKYFLESMNKLK